MKLHVSGARVPEKNGRITQHTAFVLAITPYFIMSFATDVTAVVQFSRHYHLRVALLQPRHATAETWLSRILWIFEPKGFANGPRDRHPIVHVFPRRCCAPLFSHECESKFKTPGIPIKLNWHGPRCCASIARDRRPDFDRACFSRNHIAICCWALIRRGAARCDSIFH